MKKYFKVLVAILAIAGTTNGLRAGTGKLKKTGESMPIPKMERYVRLEQPLLDPDGGASYFDPVDWVFKIDGGYAHKHTNLMLARTPRLTIKTVTVDEDGIYHGTFKEFDLKDKYPRTPYISTINDQGTLAKIYTDLQSMYEAQQAQLAEQ